MHTELGRMTKRCDELETKLHDLKKENRTLKESKSQNQVKGKSSKKIVKIRESKNDMEQKQETVEKKSEAKEDLKPMPKVLTKTPDVEEKKKKRFIASSM